MEDEAEHAGDEGKDRADAANKDQHPLEVNTHAGQIDP